MSETNIAIIMNVFKGLPPSSHPVLHALVLHGSGEHNQFRKSIYSNLCLISISRMSTIYLITGASRGKLR